MLSHLRLKVIVYHIGRNHPYIAEHRARIPGLELAEDFGPVRAEFKVDLLRQVVTQTGAVESISPDRPHHGCDDQGIEPQQESLPSLGVTKVRASPQQFF